jgi:hypothetical protein
MPKSLFTSLADKITLVKTWPGIDPVAVDAALAQATADGTIACYEVESAHNELLDIVVTVNRESVPATLQYVRDRLREAHIGRYGEFADAYEGDLDESRISLIEGATPFRPNQINIEIVDFGRTNLEGLDEVVIRRQQQSRAKHLAGFAAFYAACQNTEWYRLLSNGQIPSVCVAGLRLRIPGCEELEFAPSFFGLSGGFRLYALDVDYPLSGNFALPTVWWMCRR